MSSPRISYSPRPDATPEDEINALAACYRIILDSHAKKNAAGEPITNGDDTEGSENVPRQTEYTR